MSHLREALLTVLKDGAEFDSSSLIDRSLDLAIFGDSRFANMGRHLGYQEFCLQRELEGLVETGAVIRREGEKAVERGNRPRIYYRRAP